MCIDHEMKFEASASLLIVVNILLGSVSIAALVGIWFGQSR